MTNNREARGYGAQHKAERQRWQWEINQRPVPCARCGRIITSVDAWDLGHTDDRTGWTGPECVSCNRADGGRKRHAATNTTIRDW